MCYSNSIVCCVMVYFALGFIICAEAARAALSLAGTMLGYYPVRVFPSKTAIAPVNPSLLPMVRNPTMITITLGELILVIQVLFFQYLGYKLVNLYSE